MKLVVFGLTVSSSWGNGHATLWRGLIRSLTESGHGVSFFEKDLPYYAAHRDLPSLKGYGQGAELLLYRDWHEVAEAAALAVAASDAAMVTSYCPDGIAAANLLLEKAPALKVFYDLDTPVTLARVAAGEEVPYLPPDGLKDFDLVLSYTGGAALEALRARLGAPRVAPLYGHVDPAVHSPVDASPAFSGDLSYLGTFAVDRQTPLKELFIEPARLEPDRRFVLGGSGYPEDFPWTQNIYFVRHLPPSRHPSFFCSSRMTLNITRADMAAMGYCPSGRLFEAAACGAPIVSDWWEGLDSFFTPGDEVLIAERTEDVLAALALPSEELAAIAQAARIRALEEHRSERRARQLLALLEGASTPGLRHSSGSRAAAGGSPCGA